MRLAVILILTGLLATSWVPAIAGAKPPDPLAGLVESWIEKAEEDVATAGTLSGPTNASVQRALVAARTHADAGRVLLSMATVVAIDEMLLAEGLESAGPTKELARRYLAAAETDRANFLAESSALRDRVNASEEEIKALADFEILVWASSRVVEAETLAAAYDDYRARVEGATGRPVQADLDRLISASRGSLLNVRFGAAVAELVLPPRAVSGRLIDERAVALYFSDPDSLLGRSPISGPSAARPLVASVEAAGGGERAFSISYYLEYLRVDRQEGLSFRLGTGSVEGPVAAAEMGRVLDMGMVGDALRLGLYGLEHKDAVATADYLLARDRLAVAELALGVGAIVAAQNETIILGSFLRRTLLDGVPVEAAAVLTGLALLAASVVILAGNGARRPPQ